MWRDRCEFVRLAAKKGVEHFPGGMRARVHVGDTPMDVQAALGAGAVALGVATGAGGSGEGARGKEVGRGEEGEGAG